MSDDGFIYLRVVQQVLAGNGPVFNVGERVEAATGPLWVMILTVIHLITQVRLEYVAVGLALVMTAIGVIVGTFAATNLTQPRWRLAAVGPLTTGCYSAPGTTPPPVSRPAFPSCGWVSARI